MALVSETTSTPVKSLKTREIPKFRLRPLELRGLLQDSTEVGPEYDMSKGGSEDEMSKGGSEDEMSKGGFFGQRFETCVDHFRSDIDIVCPWWNEAPAHGLRFSRAILS